MDQRVLRIAGGTFCLVTGIVMMPLVLYTQTIEHFWVVVACGLYTVGGLLWLVRPETGVGFVAPPVAALLLLPPYGALLIAIGLCGNCEAIQRWLSILFLSALCFAAYLILRALKISSLRRALPAAISALMLLGGFVVDKRFVNITRTRSVMMSWSVGGAVPWGDVPKGPAGNPLVVAYEKVGDTYCYEIFDSPELAARLLATHPAQVKVEYNVMSDFGKERGYNLRSVAGLPFSLEDRVYRDKERLDSGQVALNGNGNNDHCSR